VRPVTLAQQLDGELSRRLSERHWHLEPPEAVVAPAGHHGVDRSRLQPGAPLVVLRAPPHPQEQLPPAGRM